MNFCAASDTRKNTSDQTARCKCCELTTLVSSSVGCGNCSKSDKAVVNETVDFASVAGEIHGDADAGYVRDVIFDVIRGCDICLWLLVRLLKFALFLDRLLVERLNDGCYIKP